MKKIIDPWGSELLEDYEQIIKDFGLEVFEENAFPEPNRLMRRGVVFAGRGMKIVSDAIKNRKPFYVLSGIMPTAPRIHLGNKMVVENIAYFQKHSARTYILVADLEAAATRGVPLEEAQKTALDFHIPAYISLGLDPKKTVFYFQSENKDVMNAAYEYAKKITLNEFRAIYGSADPGRIMGAVTQAADILYPQFEERMPGIIPVGVDQDPHIRLTRDIVNRTKAKKFFLPSSLYHRFTPSLDGDMKMSKSKPESCIELPEDAARLAKKLKAAKTGGRDSAEEQRKIGGRPEVCINFEMQKQHFIEDDKELNKIYNDCKAGRILCGECKQITCDYAAKFMNSLVKGIEKSKKSVDKLNFVRFS